MEVPKGTSQLFFDLDGQIGEAKLTSESTGNAESSESSRGGVPLAQLEFPDDSLKPGLTAYLNKGKMSQIIREGGLPNLQGELARGLLSPRTELSWLPNNARKQQ